MQKAIDLAKSCSTIFDLHNNVKSMQADIAELKLNSANLRDLKEKVDQLASEFKNLKLSSAAPNGRSHNVEEILHGIKERQQREKNLIVYKLPESQAATNDKQYKKDQENVAKEIKSGGNSVVINLKSRVFKNVTS